MEISKLLILIALLQYMGFTLKAGVSRPKMDMPAPKTSGNDIWERLFRVQQNTLEQLIVFIPGVLIFSQYISHLWVLVPGVAFILGRQIYAITYVKAPESRVLGFALTFFSNLALVIGGLIGLVLHMLG
ncbi:MAPEG family protein [Paraglaciecola aestuariivivens]